MTGAERLSDASGSAMSVAGSFAAAAACRCAGAKQARRALAVQRAAKAFYDSLGPRQKQKGRREKQSKERKPRVFRPNDGRERPASRWHSVLELRGAALLMLVALAIGVWLGAVVAPT